MDKLKEHFNEFKPGETEELGNVLFDGEVSSFMSKMSEMQSEDKIEYFKELIKQGVIDEDAGKFKDDD